MVSVPLRSDISPLRFALAEMIAGQSGIRVIYGMQFQEFDSALSNCLVSDRVSIISACFLYS